MELTLTRKKAATGDGPFTPAPPRANLLPEVARERQAQRSAKRLGIGVWAATALTVAVTVAVSYATQVSTKADLADAQAEAQHLATELARYAPVTSIATQTQALNDTVQSQTAQQVDQAQVISKFLAATAGTMQVTGLTIAEGEGGCTSIDPFNQVPLAACVTFTGTADDGTSARDVIIALGQDAWFNDPFIPSVSAGDEHGATLAGTVGVTMEAFSTRATTPDHPEDPPVDGDLEPLPGTES